MKAVALALLALLLISGAMNAAGLVDYHNARQREAAWRDTARVAQQDRTIWQAKYAATKDSLDAKTKAAKKWTTRWDTVYQDTGRRITDTAWMKETLAVADTTIRACTDALNACALFRVAADSTLRHTERERDSYKNLYEIVKPTWKDRLGLNVCYAPGQRGPVVGAACAKVWP